MKTTSSNRTKSLSVEFYLKSLDAACPNFGRRSVPALHWRGLSAAILSSGQGPAAASLRLHRTVPADEGLRPPSGPLWVHEIKHDGYRLMVRRDGTRVRCFTRGGHDWASRFPAIVESAARVQAPSFLIDGDAVIARDDGTPDFHALRI